MAFMSGVRGYGARANAAVAVSAAAHMRRVALIATAPDVGVDLQPAVHRDAAALHAHTVTEADSPAGHWLPRASLECARLSREEISTIVRIAPTIAKPAPTRKARSKPFVSA